MFKVPYMDPFIAHLSLEEPIEPDLGYHLRSSRKLISLVSIYQTMILNADSLRLFRITLTP